MARRQAKQSHNTSPVYCLPHADPWYPDAHDVTRPPTSRAENEPGKQSLLRTLIAAKMRSWAWEMPDDHEPGGVSWLELYVALLLDDDLLQQLHIDMAGRGWPEKYRTDADPSVIFRHLRTAVRSTSVQGQHVEMQNMAKQVARLKGWGIFSGIACLKGAPGWDAEQQNDVKAIILAAHAKCDVDQHCIKENIQWAARPMSLTGFTAWLNNRAGPLRTEG